MITAMERHISTLARGEKSGTMDSGQMSKTDLKVEIPSETETVEVHAPPTSASGLTRQPSVSKTNCLCSPTTHPGSFRCRLHRAPSLQRTKSTDSQSTSKQISPTAK
ncbi:hypothetical protein V6N12_056229 [Hibiscus sabdariffa]|uniref:Uncharacterized protein n=1 Tax=Hibiscus sabdariffa TaxID=183260 RepID=A0ABR2CRW4_9ROSI